MEKTPENVNSLPLSKEFVEKFKAEVEKRKNEMEKTPKKLNLLHLVKNLLKNLKQK